MPRNEEKPGNCVRTGTQFPSVPVSSPPAGCQRDWLMTAQVCASGSLTACGPTPLLLPGLVDRVLWLRAIFWILTYANYNQLHTRPALGIPSHEVSRTSSIVSLISIPLIKRTTEQTIPCHAVPLCQGLSVKKTSGAAALLGMLHRC